MRELTKNVRMATWSDELIANKDNQRREGCQGSVQSFGQIDYRNPNGLFSAYKLRITCRLMTSQVSSGTCYPQHTSSVVEKVNTTL